MFNFIVCLLPWRIKRLALINFYGYNISYSAKIGFAYVFPKKLTMGHNSYISHFNVAINLDEIIIEDNVLIDRSNWITGYPTSSKDHFVKERKSRLYIKSNTAITKKHHFDCTDEINIGAYTTIAGYNSQFLTHSIDIYKNIQDCKPIVIGDYCFVSTRSVILGGSILPSYSLLAAGGVLINGSENTDHGLYAGVPAKKVKTISPDSKYFLRKNRDVN